ncbi:hypothetical protein C095_06645 [Fusobacterium necrophorum subsp. funduliforme B35]|uniref:Uncharacterized protein n=1 Tax=Fusobacterium necrophorum subsp. funduliforme B35 TaxID=1226633 RepID=A0A0B4EVZ8_9FUSO|nr:hypothetical protein C095_06645 [Fusobacterium necrophorum subsp. funduliforme B35]
MIDSIVRMIKPDLGETIYDPAAGFRVIIMTQANSQVNTRF